MSLPDAPKPVPTDAAISAPPLPLSVSELNRLAREAIERRLPLLWVAGEISNLTAAASGHLYFTLKDSSAQARCVMFRSRAQILGWRPENGLQVEARALATLYEARGDFQLNVESLRRAGTGRLYEEFVRLKLRLDREGLFDPQAKRALPRHPRRIGIVSSPQAAALRDVVTTLRRRAPQIELIVYPTAVQGSGAAAEIVAALQRAATRRECDLLILCRGGGSIEDLWSFNEEVVARAIRACPLPLIAGIGHETDYTIADFAADLRAPTPTAAAEQAAPLRAELLAALGTLAQRATRATERALGDRRQRLDFLARRLQHPAERLAAMRKVLAGIDARRQTLRRHLTQAPRRQLELLGWRLRRPDLAGQQRTLEQLADRLHRAAVVVGDRRRRDLAALGNQLRQLDPQAVLARGYAIVADARGNVLRDAQNVEPGAAIAVNLWRGRLHATITGREPPPAGEAPAGAD